MGAWWANDPWVFWVPLAIFAAVIAALVLVFIITRFSRDEHS